MLPALENASMPAAVVAAAGVAVRFDRVCFAFDEQVVLEDLSFTLERGSMTVLLGASGAGKSVVLKLVLGLLAPDAGHIVVNDQSIDRMGERDLMRVRADIGMMFQENALFDSLTVAERRRLPIVGGIAPSCRRQVHPPRRGGARADRPPGLHRHVAGVAIGRSTSTVAIARAIAARPNLVLLDDPTAGLDPITATTIDDEIVKLRDLEHVTSVVATHQMRDAFYLARHEAVQSARGAEIRPLATGHLSPVRFLVLHQGRVYFDGTGDELRAARDSFLRVLVQDAATLVSRADTRRLFDGRVAARRSSSKSRERSRAPP